MVYQLLDGDHRSPISVPEFQERRQAHHLAVIADDFTDRRDGLQSRQHHEIDGALGVAGAFQDPAGVPSEGRTDSTGNCPSTIDSRSMSASSSGATATRLLIFV